jgi:hypothetical protein
MVCGEMGIASFGRLSASGAGKFGGSQLFP